MKIRKAFKKLICMTCAALMAVTLIPAPPAKAALPSYYRYTTSLDMAGAKRVKNSSYDTTKTIPNTGVQYIGGWVLSTLPIKSYNIIIYSSGKMIKSVNSSTNPKQGVYPYFKQYKWGFNGADASFGKEDGVTYSATNSGWCFKIDAKDLPATCTVKVTGNVTYNGQTEKITVANVTLVKSNYNTLESYLKSIGKTVKTASAEDIMDYFKNKSCNTDYLKYLTKCSADTMFASSYKSDYERQKKFYNYIQKYTKKMDKYLSKYSDVTISVILDSMYIHTCFEQLAYGNSNDDVVNGVTGAFDRIASLIGPFKKVITNHTTIMKVEYALIKARYEQLENFEFMTTAYAEFTPEMAAEIFAYALSLPADTTEVSLLHVVNAIDDYKLKTAYQNVINNLPESGKKYKFQKISKRTAEKLFLYNLKWMVDPNSAWQYLQ